MYNEWTQAVDEVAKVNLEKPLLVRDPTSSLLSVNFDPQLVALLREVKYLEQREGTDHVIPQSAASIYAQHETYRKFLQVREETSHVTFGIYMYMYMYMYIPLIHMHVHVPARVQLDTHVQTCACRSRECSSSIQNLRALNLHRLSKQQHFRSYSSLICA